MVDFGAPWSVNFLEKFVESTSPGKVLEFFLKLRMRTINYGERVAPALRPGPTAQLLDVLGTVIIISFND